MIREYTLPKTGEIAKIEVLKGEHLAQVLALQDETRAGLPDNQKMFVLPQTPDYFARLLTRDGGLMVGVRVNGQLVAHAVLMGPLTLDDAVAKNAITRNEIMFHHAQPSETVAVVKSVSVHPNWRGNELSQHILQAALDQPMARQVDHVFAQVSVENMRSWELFMRNGFGIVAAATDPKDAQPRFVLQKPALGFVLHETPSAAAIDPVDDFAQACSLSQREALIGMLDESSPSFTKTANGRTRLQLRFFGESGTATTWSDDIATVA